MAKRKVITPSRTTVRFRVPSPKNNGSSIECESVLEQDLALLAEFSRKVIRMSEQIERRIDANDLSFTTHIDFEFVIDTGEIEYHEVKYVEKAQEPEVAARLAATEVHLAKEGFRFFVDTEETIRKTPQLINNLLTLRRFKVGDEKFVESLESRIPKTLCTVEQLVRDVGDNNTAIAMIAWQLIYCDFTQPLNNQTAVRAMEDEDHAFLYR